MSDAGNDAGDLAQEEQRKMTTTELREFLEEHGITKLVCSEEPECDVEEALLEFINHREERLVREAKTDLAAEIERAILPITGKAIFTSHGKDVKTQ